MKAILVVDLPDDVNMDRVIQTPVALSFSLGDGIKQILFADGYLKAMPKKAEVSDDAYVSDYLDFDLGWNACIEKILGETE